MDRTEAGFLKAILAEPHDPLLRLTFADFLDERGDTERAEQIRASATGERPCLQVLPGARVHWQMADTKAIGKWSRKRHLLNLAGAFVRFRTSRKALPFAWNACRGVLFDAAGFDGGVAVHLWGLRGVQVMTDARAYDEDVMEHVEQTERWDWCIIEGATWPWNMLSEGWTLKRRTAEEEPQDFIGS